MKYSDALMTRTPENLIPYKLLTLINSVKKKKWNTTLTPSRREKKKDFLLLQKKNKKSQAWGEEGGKKAGGIYQVINQISHSWPMLLLFPCSDEQLHSGIMIYWATTFKLDTKMRRAWKRKLLNETQTLCLNCFEETWIQNDVSKFAIYEDHSIDSLKQRK